MGLESKIHRARTEFVEMPGLRLTVPQAMRLWGLERSECQRVIGLLVDQAFLQWTGTDDQESRMTIARLAGDSGP